MSEYSHRDLISPEAINVAKRLRTPLARAREAFQRGLGDVAKCTGAYLIFDEANDAPTLSFQVVTAHGERLLSERMVYLRDQMLCAIEERGAAFATSLKAGLIHQASRSGE